MTDLEIPWPSERKGHYRFFEIVPWGLSVSLIVLLIGLSIMNATIAAFFVLLYIFMQLSRAIGFIFQALHGYDLMHRNQQLAWRTLLSELEAGQVGPQEVARPAWHLDHL